MQPSPASAEGESVEAAALGEVSDVRNTPGEHLESRPGPVLRLLFSPNSKSSLISSAEQGRRKAQLSPQGEDFKHLRLSRLLPEIRDADNALSPHPQSSFKTL